MRAAASALTTGPLSVPGGNYITFGQIVVSADPPENSGGFGAAYIRRPPGNLTGPGLEEEAWVYPPAEVWTDDDWVVFQPTGPDSFTWTQGVATIADESGPLPGLFHIDATEVEERHPEGTLFASFVVGDSSVTYAAAGAGITYSDVTLPEFDATNLLVTIWHDGHFADIADGGGQIRLVNGTTTDEATFDKLKYLWNPAPYRYWNPAEVVAVVRKVRQFHRDDGLGVAPPRAFGGASRIRTGRAYGYD